jgi:lipase chaperone LimK
MATNLPQPPVSTSKTKNVKTFFDNFFTKTISFPAEQIDAVVGFFVKRGFDTNSANSIAITLLTQARKENVNVFALLDSLKGLTDVQLSQVITQVSNSTREKTSLLGYRVKPATDTYESRNILV